VGPSLDSGRAAGARYITGQTIVLDGGQTLGIPLEGVEVDLSGQSGVAP